MAKKMAKKNTSSREEYDRKKHEEAKGRHTKVKKHPEDSGHALGLKSAVPVAEEIGTVTNEAVVEDWKGSENPPLFVPDLLHGINSLKDEELKEALLSRGDVVLSDEVVKYVNHVAKGENVPPELDRALFTKDRSSKIMGAAIREGIHRWHSHPLNGSLGKERE